MVLAKAAGLPQLTRGTGQPEPLPDTSDGLLVANAHEAQPAGRLKDGRTQALAVRYLPLPHIPHPYSRARFTAKHPGQEP